MVVNNTQNWSEKNLIQFRLVPVSCLFIRYIALEYHINAVHAEAAERFPKPFYREFPKAIQITKPSKHVNPGIIAKTFKLEWRNERAWKTYFVTCTFHARHFVALVAYTCISSCRGEFVWLCTASWAWLGCTVCTTQYECTVGQLMRILLFDWF